MTGNVVSWPTASGYLYVADANDPRVLFRLQTSGDIVTSPAQQSPYLYIASLDGYLYCINELTGDEEWRYSTGYSITSSPAVVGDMAFVASFEPALHAIDSKTGDEKWIAPGVSHFAARGKDRIYASDAYGNVLILDAATGRQVGRLPVAEGLTTLVNDQTDRIFLVNDRGLVQCLHEIGANEPTLYRQPIAPPAAEDATADGEKAGSATNPLPTSLPNRRPTRQPQPTRRAPSAPTSQRREKLQRPRKRRWTTIRSRISDRLLAASPLLLPGKRQDARPQLALGIEPLLQSGGSRERDVDQVVVPQADQHVGAARHRRMHRGPGEPLADERVDRFGRQAANEIARVEVLDARRHPLGLEILLDFGLSGSSRYLPRRRLPEASVPSDLFEQMLPGALGDDDDGMLASFAGVASASRGSRGGRASSSGISGTRQKFASPLASTAVAVMKPASRPISFTRPTPL